MWYFWYFLLHQDHLTLEMFFVVVVVSVSGEMFREKIVRQTKPPAVPGPGPRSQTKEFHENLTCIRSRGSNLLLGEERML